MDKVKVSQDILYGFLKEHNVTKVVIAQRMGVSESIVGGCFRHALNRHGKPLRISRQTSMGQPISPVLWRVSVNLAPILM